MFIGNYFFHLTQDCDACVKHKEILQLNCMSYSQLTARATYDPTMVTSQYF